MDIQKDRARFTTTIQIPMELRQRIKAQGMTINGALIRGMEAIENEKQQNKEILFVTKSMENYRDGYRRLRARVEELEKQLKPG